MKITIESLEKVFFFVGDVALTPTQSKVEVDLSDKSDQVKAAIINGVSIGRLSLISDSSTALADIVNSIKDKKLREKLAKKTNVKFVDSEEATEAEVKALEKEKVPAAPVEEAPVEPTEPEVAPEVDELAELLKLSAAKVIESLAEKELSKEDAAKLLALEKDGKNRATVKAVLEKLI